MRGWKWMSVLILVAFAAGAAAWAGYSSVRRHSTPRLGFIVEPGEHTILPGRSSIRVFREDGGLNYRITRQLSNATETFGPARPSVQPGAQWFVYVETPDRVYDGEGRDLVLQRMHADGVGTYSITFCRDWLRKQVPPEVVVRLGEAALAAMVAAGNEGANRRTPCAGPE